MLHLGNINIMQGPDQLIGNNPTNKNLILKRVNWVSISPSLLIEAQKFHKEKKEIIAFLKESKYRLDNNAISTRVINHWTSLGLLDDNRENGKGWRKFSLIELVWIELVRTMRDFGYPSDKIKLVKEDIELRAFECDINNSLHFQFYLAIAICCNESVQALIFDNGNFEICTPSEAVRSDALGIIGSHLRIDLGPILKRLFPHMEEPTKKNLFELTPNEFEVLQEIRQTKYGKVTINLKDKIPTQIETETSYTDKINLNEILKAKENQDIEIKQRDGKVVFAKNKKVKRI